MYHKISNIASRKAIERAFERNFKYPQLYHSQHLINGFEESTVPVITQHEPEIISYGIWGLLPKNYHDSWEEFQDSFSTLTVHKNAIEDTIIFQEPIIHRRCLIIATGFFVGHYQNGAIYPFYVYPASRKPICFAGVYNILEDGFITCSIILKEATGIVKEVQNLSSEMPVLIPENFYNTWLDESSDKREIQNILDRDNSVTLRTHPIAKEFFKNNISYESILDPVNYRDISNDFA